MENFLATETLIIELLLIVSLVALVVVGLLLTFQKKFGLSLTPELIWSLFIRTGFNTPSACCGEIY